MRRNRKFPDCESGNFPVTRTGNIWNVIGHFDFLSVLPVGPVVFGNSEQFCKTFKKTMFKMFFCFKSNLGQQSNWFHSKFTWLKSSGLLSFHGDWLYWASLILTYARGDHPLVVVWVYTDTVLLEVKCVMTKFAVFQFVFVKIRPSPNASIDNMRKTLPPRHL